MYIYAWNVWMFLMTIMAIVVGFAQFEERAFRKKAKMITTILGGVMTPILVFVESFQEISQLFRQQMVGSCDEAIFISLVSCVVAVFGLFFGSGLYLLSGIIANCHRRPTSCIKPDDEKSTAAEGEQKTAPVVTICSEPQPASAAFTFHVNAATLASLIRTQWGTLPAVKDGVSK